MAISLSRGIGIEGSVGPDAAAELALLAEQSGYGSFWLNVIGREVDAIESLRLALERTRRIEIAVGVFPLDLYPAADLAARLQASGMDSSRLIVGIGAGQVRQGVAAMTEDAIRTLHAAVPACRVCVGGYGPRIQEVGGRMADVVLANWMTPERLDWMLGMTRSAAEGAGRSLPPVYLYHRCAMGADAVARLRDELAAYGRSPIHQKHQAAMGNPEWIGVAASTPADIDAQLAPYGDRCHIVLKPLPRERSDIAEWRSLIQFFRPSA